MDPNSVGNEGSSATFHFTYKGFPEGGPIYGLSLLVSFEVNKSSCCRTNDDSSWNPTPLGINKCRFSKAFPTNRPLYIHSKDIPNGAYDIMSRIIVKGPNQIDLYDEGLEREAFLWWKRGDNQFTVCITKTQHVASVQLSSISVEDSGELVQAAKDYRKTFEIEISRSTQV